MNIEQLRATKNEFKSASILYQRIQSDLDFKYSIENLYFKVFGRKLNKSCSSCWFDAYIELVYQPIEKIMNQMECKFAIRAGALLIDVINGDNDKMATNNNLTDELAIYHLTTNPSCRKFFTKPEPHEIDELLASLKTKSNETMLLKVEAKLLKIQTALSEAVVSLDKAKAIGDSDKILKAQTVYDKILQQELKARSVLEELNA